MIIFCDTSVLVAGCVRGHPHYNRARPIFECAQLKADEFFISSHSLAEVYASLTRLPVQPKIVPAEAKVILTTNILPLFKRVQVSAKLYEAAINRCVELGLSGGIIYDALLLLCAKSIHAERIYTFNVRDFQRVMPEAAERISAP